MAIERNRSDRKLRVVKAKSHLTREYIEECKALQEKILKRRNGELLPSSVDDIRAMRNGELR